MNISAKKTTIAVHLQPNAKSNEVVGFKDNTLSIRITAPPHKGQANRALLELLAQVLAVSKSNLNLVRGYTSRHKLISIEGLSSEELKDKLPQAIPRKELC